MIDNRNRTIIERRNRLKHNIFKPLKWKKGQKNKFFRVIWYIKKGIIYNKKIKVNKFITELIKESFNVPKVIVPIGPDYAYILTYDNKYLYEIHLAYYWNERTWVNIMYKCYQPKNIEETIKILEDIKNPDYTLGLKMYEQFKLITGCQVVDFEIVEYCKKIKNVLNIK